MAGVQPTYTGTGPPPTPTPPADAANAPEGLPPVINPMDVADPEATLDTSVSSMPRRVREQVAQMDAAQSTAQSSTGMPPGLASGTVRPPGTRKRQGSRQSSREPRADRPSRREARGKEPRRGREAGQGGPDGRIGGPGQGVDRLEVDQGTIEGGIITRGLRGSRAIISM